MLLPMPLAVGPSTLRGKKPQPHTAGPDRFGDLFSGLGPGTGLSGAGPRSRRPGHRPGSGSPSAPGEMLSPNDKEPLQANCIHLGCSGARSPSSAYTVTLNDSPLRGGVLYLLLFQWLSRVGGGGQSGKAVT